ncbi:MAG: L-lactate dehydrogenase complex protein LldG [Gaiellaceae bacterium]|nr:L-lactate dehydrogenase complex protein LldG [Gaiellaceae bacterium]
MSTAREEILGRVRRALADVPDGERPEDVPVPRAYLEREPEGTIERLVERVIDYGAAVHFVAADGIEAAVEEACRGLGVSRLALPPDLPAAWLPGGLEAVPDTSLDPEELDRIGAALTGCALAIAETGTIVLDGGARQGRRALTLVPDVHVCVVEEAQVVDGVPAALRRLAPGLRADRRPVTFVSGPSATSDIELSRVEGVHGPRRFALIVART